MAKQAKKSQATNGRSLVLKVSEKGALSIYGLQKFPVSLYMDQWNDILDKADAIRDYMDKHSDELKPKPDSMGGPKEGGTAI